MGRMKLSLIKDIQESEKLQLSNLIALYDSHPELKRRDFVQFLVKNRSHAELTEILETRRLYSQAYGNPEIE